MCVIIVGIIPPYKFQWWVLGRNMRGSSIHSYRNCQGQFDRRFGSSFQIGSAEQYSAQEFKTFIMEQSELPIRATLATPPTSRFLVEKSWAPQPPSRYWWLGVLHQPSCLDHSSIYYECTRSKPKAERNNTDEAKDLSFWFFFFFCRYGSYQCHISPQGSSLFIEFIGIYVWAMKIRCWAEEIRWVRQESHACLEACVRINDEAVFLNENMIERANAIVAAEWSDKMASSV